MDDPVVTSSKPKSSPGIEAKRRLIFGDFEFHPVQKSLFYKSSPCHLDSKMLDLLGILIEARPHLVKKEFLMEKLWPDAEVSDWSLARLVSDTRKLIEDDGKSQNIIKTIRGKGFAFAAQADEIIEAYPDSGFAAESNQVEAPNIEASNPTTSDHFNSNKPTDFRLAWISSVFFLIASASLIYFSRSGDPSNADIKPTIARDKQQEKIEVMLEIQKNLVLTKTAFISQVRRRNELGELILAKRPDLEALSWEQRFRQYYPSLTKDEKFLFDQIKAMTEGPLLKGNSEILRLLKEHPEMYQELELFLALNSHLEIWVNKYHDVYAKRQDIPLVYVGVEDGVPFPSAIDDQVASWLKKAAAKSKPKQTQEPNSNSK